MSRLPEAVAPLDDSMAEGDGVRSYTVLSLIALAAVALALLPRGLGPWAFFPSLVGALVVTLRWRAGPVLVLFSLFWLGLADRNHMSPWGLVEFFLSLRFLSGRGLWRLRDREYPLLEESYPFLDLILCAAVVAYVAANFRLLGVTRQIFPAEGRRPRPRADWRRPALTDPQRGRDGVPPPLRSPALVDPQEGAVMIFVVTACACLAQFFWLWLEGRDASSDLSALFAQWTTVNVPDGVWRLVVLVWVLALVLIPVTGLLAYLGHRRLSPQELGLYLQDQLWRQTRREQARLSRWRAWAVRRMKR